MRALVLALTAAVVVTACQKGVVCGADTKEENGQCVPKSLAKCGDGTKLVGTECVPASTLACGAGTVEQDGKCVAHELTCGPGTEEQDGVCVESDPMKRVTVPEAPEPNIPPGKSARFTVPAIGAAPAVLGGVIDVPTQGSPDFDGFVFHATRLERVHFAATAIGDPSVGVVVLPCKSTGTDVCDLDQSSMFGRFALTEDARGASRDVVIPYDGDWIALVSDQSNLTQGLPYGASDFSYTVDVTQVAMPDAVPATPGTAMTGDETAIAPISLDVTQAQTLFDVTLAEPDATAPFNGQRALWALGGDGKVAFAAEDDTSYGVLTPMPPQRVAFVPGRALIFPDDVYAVGTNPPFTLTLSPVPVTSMGDLSAPFSGRATLASGGQNVFSVDAPANSVLDLTMLPADSGTQIAPQIELRDAHYQLVASGQAFHLARFVGVAEAGRYYVVTKDRTFDASKTDLDYAMKAEATPATLVGPLGLGQQDDEVAHSPDSGKSWFAVYAANDEDLGATVHPDPAVAASLKVYPQTAVDPLDSADGAAGADVQVAPRLVGSGSLLLFEVDAPPGGAFHFVASARQTAAVFEQEPNDTTATANALTLDASGHATASGTLSSLTDQDYYAVTLTQPGTITAETHPGLAGDVPDTELAIVNASGSYLAYSDDWNGTVLSHGTATVGPGTYYVMVTDSWIVTDPAGGDYVLTVDVQ